VPETNAEVNFPLFLHGDFFEVYFACAVFSGIRHLTQDVGKQWFWTCIADFHSRCQFLPTSGIV